MKKRLKHILIGSVLSVCLVSMLTYQEGFRRRRFPEAGSGGGQEYKRVSERGPEGVSKK